MEVFYLIILILIKKRPKLALDVDHVILIKECLNVPEEFSSPIRLKRFPQPAQL